MRMKKTFRLAAIIMSIAILVQLLPGVPVPVYAATTGSWTADVTPEPWSAGTGTAESPFEISSVTQFVYMAQEQNGGRIVEDTYFKLTADLDLEAHYWVPVGDDTNPFKGCFDGNGHIISNVITNPADTRQYVGLFGNTSNTVGQRTKIINLGVIGANISLKNTAGMAGILVGSATDTNIENCFVRGTLSSVQNNADECIGGVIGYGNGVQICNSYSAVTITNAAAAKAGGLAGVLNNATIVNGFSDVSLTAVSVNSRTGTITGYPRDIDTGTMKASETTSKSAVSSLNYWLEMQKNQAYYTWSVTPGSYPVFGVKYTPIATAAPANIADSNAGTEANPYRIATKENLLWISENYRGQSGFTGKFFQQTADIDMTNVNRFLPIGDFDLTISSVDNPFNGTYDGNGFKITNLTILDTVYERGAFGLFGVIGSSGVVKNLTLEDANVTGRGRNYSSVGVLAGKNNGVIKYCRITKTGAGSIIRGETSNYLGAVVGQNGGIVKKCTNYLNVVATTSNGTTGGIAGSNYDTVSDCLNMGNVTGSNYGGGIIGIHERTHARTNLNMGTTQTADGLIIGVLRSGQTAVGNYYFGTTAARGIYLDQNGAPNKDLGCSLINNSSDLARAESFTSFDFVNNWTLDGGEKPIPRPAIAAPAIDLTPAPGTATGTSKITVNEALGAGQTLHIRKFFGSNTTATPDRGDYQHSNSVAYTSGTDITLTTLGQPVTRIAVYFVNSLGNIEKFSLVEITDELVKGQIGAIGNQTFQTRQEGFDAGTQETKTISVYNSQARSIRNLSVALSGASADKFTVTQPLQTTLAGYSTTTFTVKAINNLLVGDYTATVLVKSGAYDLNQGSFNVSQTIQSTPAPASVPTMGSFTDTDGDESQIGGSLSWTAASPTVGIVGYKVYWGSNTTTKLAGNTDVVYTVPGSSTTSHTVPANTVIPAGATHLLIYSYNSSGESASCLAVPVTDIVADIAAPILTAGSVNRTGNTTGTVRFTSNENGQYYYSIVAAGAAIPAIDTSGVGTACTAGEITITDPAGLAAGAKDIYIKVKDAAGNVSAALKIVINAYVNPADAAAVAADKAALAAGGFTYGGSDTASSVTQNVTLPSSGSNGTAITWEEITDTDNNISLSGNSVTVVRPANGQGDKTVVLRATITRNGVSDTKDISIIIKQQAASTSSSGSSSSSSSSAPASVPNNTAPVTVNGQTQQSAAVVSTQTQNNQTVTTVAVDEKKIVKSLENAASNTVVTLPINMKSDVVVGELTGQTVKTMEQKEAVLEIRTEAVTYTLPASQINIDNVASAVGADVKLSDIKVQVTIAEPPAATVKVVEDTANKGNLQVVVKPVEFNITCTYGSKTTEVSRFNGYVERTVAIPDGVDPSKITTGIVLNADGSFSHVPTQITTINGKHYAKINSLTNSTYSVIWNPKTFKDVENHWAKEAVNDMGSRLVISGTGGDAFAPDRDITRAEFAAIVVRALGLMRPGTGKDVFKDVEKGTWYYDTVYIAYENGIISGNGYGMFGPMDKITREQAMVMIARAMKITKLNVQSTDTEIEQLLAEFDDTKAVSAWARDNIALCIKSGIISGKGGKSLAPQDKITRAEVAVIVKRLLQKSHLI